MTNDLTDERVLTRTIKYAKRGVNRSKREAVARVGIARRYSSFHYRRRLARHEANLPDLQDDDRRLVDQLSLHAISHPSLDALAGSSTSRLQDGLLRLTELLEQKPTDSASTVRPSAEELMCESGVWRWGLDHRLLDIAENYLGLPAWYYGMDVRREVADGRPVGVRQWHLDNEDRRILKILIWLNDVDDEGGPLARLTLDDSRLSSARLRYVSGFVPDKKLRAVVDEARWFTCPGPRWHVNLIDTARLMHRATPPRSRDRYSVTFTWTSRHPASFHDVPGAGARNVHAALAGLDDRQRAALPPQWSRLTEESWP